MKKRLVIIGIFLLTATSLYSLNTYPSKIVIEGDTLVAISESHLIKINETFSSNNFLSYKIALQDELLQKKDSISSLKSSMIDSLCVVLDGNTKIISELNKDNKELQYQLTKTKTKFKYSVGAIITLILINILK